MRILIACEFSGIVRDAFRAKGHDAVSCDLLPTERPGPHIQGDVIEQLEAGWDLMIAHPPCTYLCNSGVRWLYKGGRKSNGEDVERWENMGGAVAFFAELQAAPIPRIAIENPVMHKHAGNCLRSRPDFTIQPWQFGDPFKKRTCFWTRNLAPLVPCPGASSDSARAAVHLESPGKDRWKKRSRTYPGIARAMAEQWGT